MTPRVLIIQTFYPEFLEDLYDREPELAGQSFENQCARLFGAAFSTSDAYSHELRSLGCETWEVICNADAAQDRWARDHAIPVEGNIHDKRRATVAAQAKQFRPDVIYIFEWSPLGDDFVACLRALGRLVVGEIASPLPEDRTFANYDLMISSWPPIVEHFRSIGIDAEHVRLGFDRRILDRLPQSEPLYDVSFVGGFAPSHPDRIAWLEEILREVPVDVFCYGLDRTSPDSPIRGQFRGQAWGWDMYRALQGSRVTLNRHARLDVRGSVNTEWVNNMRMYEASGVGTCLFTERRRYLDRLFVPDREVVTYGDTAECIEKIRYYLRHETERAAIAQAGQQRTLREHLYAHRMRELLEIFNERLGRTSGTKPRGREATEEVRSSKFEVQRGGNRATRQLGTEAIGREGATGFGLRIGLLPALKRADGGIFQYSLTLLEQLHQLSECGALDHEFVIFAHVPSDPILERFTSPRWSVRSFRPPWAPQSAINLAATPSLDAPLEQPDMQAWFAECGIDLMIYPSPHRLSFECGLPFVMAIHDLQHALQPEFPEVSADGEWLRREYMLRNAARHATLLIAESVVGREDILRVYGAYGARAERVKVLPYLPGSAVDLPTARARLASLRERHHLPARYLFYPAQLWPHKNHLRIIDALGQLRFDHDLVIPLILTGASSGVVRERTATELRDRIEAHELSEQVRMLDYLPDEDIAALYTGAVALVMPTFFGPTNIPFLEAWALECPVLTSRIRGIVEQVGDAAWTVDPTSECEIADGIRRLWTDENLRATLIERGKTRLTTYTAEDFRRRLASIIEDAAARVRRSARVLEGARS